MTHLKDLMIHVQTFCNVKQTGIGVTGRHATSKRGEHDVLRLLLPTAVFKQAVMTRGEGGQKDRAREQRTARLASWATAAE